MTSGELKSHYDGIRENRAELKRVNLEIEEEQGRAFDVSLFLPFVLLFSFIFDVLTRFFFVVASRRWLLAEESWDSCSSGRDFALSLVRPCFLLSSRRFADHILLSHDSRYRNPTHRGFHQGGHRLE